MDGRQVQGMTACLVDLLRELRGLVVVMGLYLVPHAQVVLDATCTARAYHRRRRRPGQPLTAEIVTVAKAVGTDVTGHLAQALEAGQLGVAQLLLDQYLRHDVLLAVSAYTKERVVAAGARLDQAFWDKDEDKEEEGVLPPTYYEDELRARVEVSYPPFDTSWSSWTRQRGDPMYDEGGYLTRRRKREAVWA